MIHSFKNIFTTILTEQISRAERYNIYFIRAEILTLPDLINYINNTGIESINIGFEIAKLLESIKITKSIGLDIIDNLRNMIKSKAVITRNFKTKTIALYNLGILFEPDLGLDPTYILKELSKTITILIIWEHQSANTGKLFWDTLQPSIGFDFKDINIKEIKIDNEI